MMKDSTRRLVRDIEDATDQVRDALNLDAEGNPKGVWTSFETWHATVSARTRRWNKGPNDPAMLVGGRVGRGEGPTPLIAAMRAYVESVFGDEIGEVTPEIPETDSLGG